MEPHYDVVLLGTGLTECVLAGMLASEGKTVLVLDANPYYGADCASLTLQECYTLHGRTPVTPIPVTQNNQYAIDQVTKLVLASGKLTKILISTGVVQYETDWMVVDGSYVQQGKKLYQVPVTPEEALSSNLMGFFEKRRCAKFLLQCLEGKLSQNEQATTGSVFKEFGLEDSTQTFLGHTVALYNADTYLTSKPMKETASRIVTYYDSLMKFSKSPYIYPLNGMSVLPQLFARYCAARGGVFRVGCPKFDIDWETRSITVAEADGSQVVVSCDVLVSNPFYIPKPQKCCVGRVVRCVCVLSHPVQGISPPQDSCQIIIPGKETPGRSHDIYITVLSSVHKVCPAGKYIALISTTAETPNPENEIEYGLKWVRPVEDMFIQVSDLVETSHPEKLRKQKVFVTKSYDASSHFESTAEDILELFEGILGKPFDLEHVAPPTDLL
eukprot:PhF_6_TR32399/c0_g1_i1/m.48069/K17255/GDI1_2; Rab GDP dissociation inhibitor